MPFCRLGLDSMVPLSTLWGILKLSQLRLVPFGFRKSRSPSRITQHTKKLTVNQNTKKDNHGVLMKNYLKTVKFQITSTHFYQLFKDYSCQLVVERVTSVYASKIRKTRKIIVWLLFWSTENKKNVSKQDRIIFVLRIYLYNTIPVCLVFHQFYFQIIMHFFTMFIICNVYF